LAAVGLALIGPMVFLKLETSRFVSTVGYSMLYVGYGCILLAAVTAGNRPERPVGFLKGRTARLLALAGAFSYPIYLWHQDFARFPLMGWLGHGGRGGALDAALWLAGTTAYVVVACGAGVAMSALVERPTLALRDRLF